MSAWYPMPGRGGFFLKERVQLAAGSSRCVQLAGRRPRFITCSVATGVCDLYVGDRTGADPGMGDFRWTPARGAPETVPVPHGMSADQWTVWNSSDEALLASLIFAE
jgi:hypothetical protein